MNPLIVIMRMMVLYGIFFLYLYNIYTHCLVCQQRLLMGFYMKLNIKISKNGNIEVSFIGC